MLFAERPRGWTAESVTRLVAEHGVRLGLDDQSRAFMPNEFTADQSPRAVERMRLEKLATEKLYRPVG